MRRKSIALNSNAQPRIYRTFEDWQAEQQLDERTPEQRGIRVGSMVMWRHRSGNVIVTDHATVTAISHNTLTLLVKDVRARTCSADIREIVNHTLAHLTLNEASRRVVLSNQTESPGGSGKSASSLLAQASAQARLTDVMDTGGRAPWDGSAKSRGVKH
jgi:hypothetical protein